MIIKTLSKQLLYSVLAAGLLFSTACKKDKDGGGPIETPTKKLVKIEESANTYVTFEYNADGTIKKVNSIEDGDPESVMQISYNANKSVNEVTSDDGSVIKYVYANNQLSKSEIYSEGEIVSFNDYTYQGGKLAMVTAVAIMEDEEGETINLPYMKTEFTYYGNNDLKEVKISVYDQLGQNFEVASVRKFEQYDNKPNPLAQLSFLNFGYFANLSARNALLEKAFDAEGNLEETIQNEFTYDSHGYPITCKTTTTPVGETPEVTNMKFFYN